MKKLQSEKLKPKEQITLEPYERDHAVVVGTFKYVDIVVVLLFLINSISSLRPAGKSKIKEEEEETEE